MKQQVKFVVVMIVTLTCGWSTWAAPGAERPDIIPLDNVRPEATDLVWKGRVLLPQEAAKLRDSGTDLSTIDPDNRDDLWKPDGQHPKFPTDSSLQLNPDKPVRFVDFVASPVKTFRFVIQGEDTSGRSQMYTLFVAKRLQTYLLRRNLMRKLGYYVPPMQRLARVDVSFKNRIQIDESFLGDKRNGITWNALGDKEWILNFDDKNATTLQMQDVLLVPMNDQFVNLTFGVIKPDINMGRRMINALIVPFNLVDLKESINGFRWHSASIKSNSLYMPLEDEEQFTTTISDAKWAMARVNKLTRADWQEIVSNGLGYPQEAQKLLVEKLISRRNELNRLMKTGVADIEYNPAISDGENLIAGELSKGEWPGIASRLAQVEDPSLISGPEMKALLKSKGISTVIGELVSKMNTELIPSTDLSKIAFEKQQDRVVEDFTHFIKTGENVSREFGMWVEPVFKGNVIASREVVAGTFLGSDNRVQLVDTLGFQVETGLHVGTTGLPAGLSLSGGAQVFYTRQYSHLKPLHSIKISLEEPYRNIVVPMIKHEWAAGITPEDFELRTDEKEEDRNKRITEAAKKFKTEMGDGESLIISDSIGGSANIQGGYSFADRIRAQAQLAASMVTLSRLHINRRGDEIHVYRDYGNIKSLQFVISLKAHIEILNMRFKLSKAKATTDFYAMDLSEDIDENPTLANTMAAVRSLLLTNSVERVAAVVEPTKLEHDLKESSRDLRFLIWNSFSLKSRDNLKITRANEVEPEYYLRRLIGSRSGRDYQTVAVDLLNEILFELTDHDVNISNSTSGDPADTVFGRSSARYSFFEGEYTPKNPFSEMFVGINYRWKGWSAGRNVIETIVTRFSERFDFQFFHPEAFQQVKVAELYNMDLTLSIYDRGVKSILSLQQGPLTRIIEKHFVGRNPRLETLELKAKTIRTFFAIQGGALKAIRENDYNDAGDYIVKLVSLLESCLDHQGLLAAVGGLQNIRIQPVLTGFMRGEDGKFSEIPIEGNEIGQVGSDRPWGPMTTTQRDIGMTEAEFFVYWLMRKI